MKKNHKYEAWHHHALKKTFLVMRIVIVISLVCIMQSFALESFTQNSKISLTVKEMKLEDIMMRIEDQTKYRFAYNKAEIDVDKSYSVVINNVEIKEVLDKLFLNGDIRYNIIDRQIVLSSSKESSITQQQKSISGKVTDSTGAGLPGVSIVVKGTTTGVITDANGNYSILNVSGNATLQFSFVGMKMQEIEAKGKSTIDVVLADENIGIEEVVAVGYGVMKKNDLTGSVGSVSSDVIISKGTTSVMSGLQGTIPGVNITSNSARPGGSFSIQIRGQNSIAGGVPLYVVDGVVTDDIDFINPSDIEKIDILKDASSTAIYGSRGSNGVVLVQTKNASSVKSTKLTISYDGYSGFRKIAHTPDFMNGREWIDFRTSAYYTWNEASGQYILPPTNQVAVLQKSKLINQRLYDEDYTDWIGLATQNGQQQNHYINISGNAKDISYNIGLGYQNEDGNLIQEYMDRYNLKISVNHRPSKYFQSGATANISQTTFDAGSMYGYRDIMKMPCVFSAFDETGNIIVQPGIQSSLQAVSSITGTANPLLEISAGIQETRRYDVVTSLFTQVTPLKGFDIKSTLSSRLNRTRLGRYYGVVLANRSVDYASSKNDEDFDWTLDNQISYNNKFNEHHVNATFINSIYHTRYEALTVAAQDLPYKSYWYNIFSGSIVPDECKSSYAETALVSYAGRINYDYKGKYFATATIRYDGSSKLAKKWESFPSFALAWRASEEEFIKKDWLTNLKARFSFGYSGNNNGVRAYGTQISPVTTSEIYYDFDGVSTSGFLPGPPVNQNLTWESTRELNFGIDYGLFNGRINGTIDVYDKLSSGLLMLRRLAIESGVKSMTDNIGSVSNKGIELSLSTINIKKKDFFWSTSFTFSRNRNAIQSLYGRKEDVVGESLFIGSPINVIFDYKILGVWSQAEYDAGRSTYYNESGKIVYKAKPGEAKTLDANADGILGAEDKVILGTPDAKWIGSFTSSMQYKNWDFSFNVYTNQKVFVYDEFLSVYGYNTQRGMAKVKFDYYIPTNVPLPDWNNFSLGSDGNATVTWGTSGIGNENSKYPIYKNSNGAFYGNNGNYQDASFVKVKNITLGYTFNKNLIKKIGMEKLRFYINVLNPFIFSKYLGWDPEYASTALQNGNGPSNITYQFGMNIKF